MNKQKELRKLQKTVKATQDIINSLPMGKDTLDLISEDSLEKLLTISNYLYDVKEEIDRKLSKAS